MPSIPVTFFSDLPQSIQDLLQSIGQEKYLVAGESLIEKDDVDHTLYWLESGELGVEKDNQIFRLQPGDIVGEVCFLDNRARTATVTALTTCKVLAFEREASLAQFCLTPIDLHALITRLASLQGSRLKEEAAKDPRSPAQCVDDLAQEALQHRAVNHAYLEAMATGAFPSLHGALADFAENYYGYSAHFPRYLTALISRLEKQEHRKALLENLTEESGQYEEEELLELQECGVQPEWIVGIPHPELFKRFRVAIGVGNTTAAGDHIEVVCWREQFLAILNTGSAAEALGALGLGTETIVQTIYQPFVHAINKLGTLKPEDAVFFPLHTAVDDHHQATLKAIASDFAATAEGRADLAKGMRKALALRDSFWSWLHERAMAG
jgi:CRP-like cAMP-binding protein